MQGFELSSKIAMFHHRLSPKSSPAGGRLHVYYLENANVSLAEGLLDKHFPGLFEGKVFYIKTTTMHCCQHVHFRWCVMKSFKVFTGQTHGETSS